MPERRVILQVEQLLGEALGLNPTSIGSNVIRRAVLERMEKCSISKMQEYWAHLYGNSAELQELIEDVVVPETWFFRNPEAMTMLTTLFTTKWPAQRGPVRRVLTVPCATGEEPYSIAIALKEAGLSRDQVVIDAVDISRRSLERAEKGIYTSNSFRGTDASVRNNYCRTLPKGVELDPEIRKWVRFTYGNLINPDFTTPAQSYDAIFCRNLLIYLNRPALERVFSNLNKLLAPEGHLFVGPAEAPVAAEFGFAPLGFDMAFAHQRASESPKRLTGEFKPIKKLAIFPTKGSGRATPAPKIHKDQPKHTDQSFKIDRRTEPRTSEPANELDKAFRLADEGNLGEAVKLCEAYLRSHSTSAAAFYLLGILNDAMGEISAAATCYRKALFLDPNHVDASTHLGMLAHRQGDTAGAERLRARARRASNKGKPVR
jgi:chemotaxis protein methyltransferase WspC